MQPAHSRGHPRARLMYPSSAARRRQFITHLTRLGVVRHAARETGIDPKTAYTRARTDRNFAVQWAAALGKDMDIRRR